jgi:hypothetical protein
MTTPTQLPEDTSTTAGRAAVLTAAATATFQLAAAWDALVAAQRALLARLQHITTAIGRAAAIRNAGTEFSARVAAFDRDARAVAERWAAVDLPTLYRDGALRALARAGADIRAFTWTANHQAAITSTTAVFWADLIRRITETVRRAQAFARAAAEAARTLEGADPDRLLAEHPLGTVIYADQARHPARDWATSALLAQAATTANRGAIQTGVDELDTVWFECADGPDCGFTAHQDPDHAAGTLRTADAAAAYPIAHPGCVRSWTPRPDLTGRTDIADGAPA